MTQTHVQPATPSKIDPLGFASLLVHGEPGSRATHRVAFAAALARRFGARLIGLGAETFDPMPSGDPYFGYAAPEWAGLLQEQVNADLKDAEAAFRRDAAGADIEWRAVQAYPSRVLSRVARAADLVIVSPRKAGPTMAADPAEVAMHAGRPVLIVPDSVRRLQARTVVVAWKDTREARRAVADALPFLIAADEVIVQAVCEGDAVEEAVFQTEDVVAQLKRHGVSARANVSTAAPEGVARELERIAALNEADLIVAGAYGHSRVQEWAFGGVTDALIHEPPCCVLMSH